MKQDRFLIVILGIIGLLAVAALGSFFMRQNSQSYGPDDTPEGVIRNYVLALNLGDYEKAYGYIATNNLKPDFEDFERRLIERKSQLLETTIRIISTEINDNHATVILNTAREGVDPFNQARGYSQSAALIFQDGSWKIVDMPYSLWY
ncbi:MAG TPA: hypothetical protein DEH22_13705 [Chloroflexi bacterium]|nr:hypothetical protein [Chloroflexota bacterium]